MQIIKVFSIKKTSSEKHDRKTMLEDAYYTLMLISYVPFVDNNIGGANRSLIHEH